MKIPTFNNPQLYNTVFTHRSYLNESEILVESNERLEFLGDSIFSFVVSSYIYEQFPHMKEGELTNLRSVLTNTQTFYELAQKLNLGDLLKLSRGEEASGGRENKSILANTLEALIGGIYLDQGLEITIEFVKGILISKMDEIVKKQGLKDSKSQLQEHLQEKHKISPLYKIIKEEGPDHAKVYTIGVYLNTRLLAEGTGHSKQEAEKAAAANALLHLP